VATSSVGQLLRVPVRDIHSMAGRDVLLLGETPIPVASLAETLGLPGKSAPRAGDLISAVILVSGEQKVAFVVDGFLTEQEVLVKSLGSRIQRTRHVTGATLMPTGKVALVINAASITRTALGQATRRLAFEDEKPRETRRGRLLVVEDSLTTRTLMKSILEAAGYEASVAADGAQAWKMLGEKSVDLVVTDVEMPNMDGFELTSAIRRSEQLARLPVVLVTSRGSDEDKRRGISVGADAYLVKSGFDQENLLQTIRQLL
jgi:two-component system chemotaxis sensor kinase CheA